MRKSFLALAAAALCCLSCIEINYGVGSDLIPQNQRYKIYTRTIPIENITMEMADSLSGYSKVAAMLEPPFLPLGTMKGTSRSMTISLDSTTLTNPTGAPMTRAGLTSPESMSSQSPPT